MCSVYRATGVPYMRDGDADVPRSGVQGAMPDQCTGSLEPGLVSGCGEPGLVSGCGEPGLVSVRPGLVSVRPGLVSVRPGLTLCGQD